MNIFLMMDPKHFVFLLLISACIFNESTEVVTQITPREGSTAGGTRITILGTGFSKDQFSFGDGNENNGNEVTLVNDDGESVGCDIHKDGCTETQIMCYTKQMKQDKAYKVNIKVDGVTVPTEDICPSNANNCKFTPRNFYTPTFDSISPQSGKPGDIILTTHGRIITTRYGDNTLTSSNGQNVRLLRIYSPQACNMFQEKDVFYGLSLDSEDEDEYYGTLICKPEGTFVGNANFSTLIEAPFGRSSTDMSLLRVSADDVIYTIQYYTDISGLSASEGSIEGGQLLTISGDFYETNGSQSTYKEAEVFVGGEKCEIVEVVTDSNITCRVPAQPATLSQRGNRGVIVESWSTPTFSTLDDALATAEAATSTTWYDETKYCGDVNAKWTRMKGVFVAPHNGKYIFWIKAEHGGKLSVEGETATSSGGWAETNSLALTAGSEYTVTAVGKSGSNAEACVHVKVHHLDTKFTHTMTGLASAERQKISITSTVETEQFTMAFSGFSAATSTSEVQKICPSGSQSTVQIGLFGVYCEPVDFTNVEGVQTALNKLPFLADGESFTVAQGDSGCIDITFNSDRGNVPHFETIPSTDFTVTETTAGVSNNTVFTLQFNGRPSPVVSYNADGTAFAAELEAAIKTMFSVQCPSRFTSGYKVYQGFEDGPNTLGTQVTAEVDAFCGRYSIKNNGLLYPPPGVTDSGISASLYPYLCFAFRDLDSRTVRLRFKNTLDETVWKWVSITPMSDGNWNYTCVNLLSAFSDTTYKLVEAKVFQGDTEIDFYIDEVFIGQKPTTDKLASIENLRMPPAFPNSDMPTTMEDVTVTYDAANDNFAVELAPHDCGHDLDLVTLSSSTLTGTDDATSMTVTSQLEGQSGSLTATRTGKASGPVQGTLSIAYGGQTSAAIDVELEDDGYKAVLESLSNIQTLLVERTEESTCANMDVLVTFDDMPGDKELMTVASSALTPSSAAAQVVSDSDGYLAYDPIVGDMFFTLHDTPQVTVSINRIPTKCAMVGNNCPYSWTSSATPTVTAISSAQGNYGDTLTITGTAFDATPANNKVTIGGVTCDVTSSSATQIVCTVGSGPLETFSVKVYVDGKGYASGTFDFTYTAALTSFSPAQSSLGGNVLLTLTGTGFAEDSVVSVGGANCFVTSVTVPNTIECIVPPYSDLSVTSDQPAQVSVSIGATQLNTPQSFIYTYDPAQITAVTPEATLTVHGGQIITIDGTSMGTTGQVFISKTELTVLSRSDSQIVVQTPVPIEPGRQLDLLVHKGDSGIILTSSNQVPKVDITLEVTNLYPTSGSLYGGTPLTVTGEGFGTNTSAVSVFIGDTTCDVSSVTNTEIQCELGDSGTVHEVNNEGTTGFGVYFAFSQKSLTIAVGDKVHWSYKTPEFVYDVQHGIYETETLTSYENKVGGISSGTPGRNGQFTWRFTKTGTYYFWSGFADKYNIKHYRMTVVVIDREDWKDSLTVTVADQEADYITDSGVADPTDNSCGSLATIDITGCTPATISDPDNTMFNFLFTQCRSPKVTAIDFTDALSTLQRSGTMATEITISGSGFWTSNCANKVFIGDCPCTISSSTSEQIICTPDSSCSQDIGVLLPVTVNVNKYGNALIAVDTLEQQSVAFVPLLQSLLPTSGSMRGGTSVTLTGYGFDTLEDVVVTFGGIPAECKQVNPLVCTSPMPALANPGALQVSVSVNGYEAVCDVCSFNYDSTITPAITSVTPDSISGPTTLTIVGSGFGSDNTKVTVSVGGEACTGVTLTSTAELTCSVLAVPAGTNEVLLTLEGIGTAVGSIAVSGEAIIDSISPTTGSIYGGTTLTFSGHGFTEDISIEVSGADICSEIAVVSLTSATCTTVPHTAGTVSIAVTSNGMSFPSQPFDFADSATPTVSSITPDTGSFGTSVTIVGQNFGTDSSTIQVTIGGEDCTSVALSGSDITCNIGVLASGTHTVIVSVAGKGMSNNNIQFAYHVTISSISPTSGDELGNQLLTLSGSGFTDTMQVTVCDVECVLDSVTSSSYVCVTPAGTGSCDVKVIDSNEIITAPTQYTYAAGVAPTITSVTPSRGGTGGNTAITLAGTGFSGTQADNVVTIAGVSCTVSSATTTEIVCNTGAHSGSIVTSVVVSVDGVRATSTGEAATFYYVDAWSSPATWGNGPIPGLDEMVVIPKGQTVLLDQDTEVLAMLVIEGMLIFDEKDVTLKAQRILLNNGGALRAGTEENPFQSKAIIELYGHHRDEELPIYGTKVLAVRNGTLDLHGLPIAKTWTRLASTAVAGATQITLLDGVADWKVGDEIVIASTGGKFSFNENEMRTITAKSADSTTLTLDSALAFGHLGTSETYAGPNGPVTVDFRAEVGLLTRNVVVRGNSDTQWERKIEACAEGFNPGEFITMTCFEGRFGEEMGNDQFGAQIMFHQPEKDTQIAQGHLSYIEVTHGGQAFRLGRYPIHFHLNGDMSKSYIKGCGIHHTYNRAINIHGSHNTNVKDNVVYHVMGGSLFLEDGIETGVTYDSNLVVQPISSSSLLNEDITPAAFWITNPNNTYKNNAAAGGTHFGYWYRMNEHTDGPSYDPSICPRRVPLQKFVNNTAHSFGWFGLWAFPIYFPTVDASCAGGEPVPAKIEDFVSWNNEKGIEFVDFSSVHILRATLVNNKLAGFEGKRVLNGRKRDTTLSSVIQDTLIVGRPNNVALQNSDGFTHVGIVLPWGESIQIRNTKFLNFDTQSTAAIGWTKIDGTCTYGCGGYNYQTSDLQFDNVANRLRFRWPFEAVVEDEDGSLCDSDVAKIYPDSGTSTPSACANTCTAVDPSGLPAAVCPSSMKFHRMAFNGISPSSLEGKNVTITNQYGTSKGEFLKKRLTHPLGWMILVVDGETYTLDWENAENMTNVTFNGQLNELASGDCVIFRMRVSEQPDMVSIDGLSNDKIGLDPFTCTTSGLTNGDWFYENSYVHIAVIGGSSARKRRAMTRFDDDLSLEVLIQKCLYPRCIPPENPETAPPPTERPSPFSYWDNMDGWEYNATTGLRTYSEEPDGNGLPAVGDDVLIPILKWVVIKEYDVPKLGTVTIEGGLEIDYSTAYDYTFEADYIIIIGGRFVVGWQNNPIELGTANIILAGNRNSPLYTELDGYEVGNKAIGVFGALELNGRDIGSSWVRLKQTAAKGATTLTVADGSEVSKWRAGDTVVITSTSTNPEESEERMISSVDASTGIITLTSSLAYRHAAGTDTVNGVDILLGAAVGLLTRSIIIEGEYVAGEVHGGRVLASITTINDELRTGYVRAAYTQFKNMGQEGYTESYDPRFALAYVQTGTVSDVKPSNVTGCSFVNLFNSAVGAFGIGGLTIENNVVYKPVGNGIVTSSDNTVIDNNLVVNMLWTGSYNGRSEAFNFRYEAGVEAMDANGLVLTNNYVSGSQRIGYHVPGEECSLTEPTYSNNYAAGNLMGVAILPADDLSVTGLSTCVQLSGFITYKNKDYGIYYQNIISLTASDNIYSDNQVGLFPMVIGSSILGHVCGDEMLTVKNSVVIGQSSQSDCSQDTTPSGTYLTLSALQRGLKGPGGERIGILFGTFSSGSNKCPEKKCAGIMAYNTLCGKLTISDTAFTQFGSGSLGCTAAFAVSTNKNNDDLQHPVIMQNSIVSNVDDDYKVAIHRPNVELINPADCVDMDCDALKKALLKDLDGTFLGSTGSVIPQSEWEWGGDPRRGLSDVRVPKDMRTTVDGMVLTVDEIAPNGKGIVRSDVCTLKQYSNHAHYWCPGLLYEMMVIESLDADTETRRLSPVAIRSDGYIDLINGPQDHGWCNGYTCQKRVSAFHALILPDKQVDVYLSSTQPDKIRFFMLDAADDKCVVVSLYYLNPNRIDVYTNDGQTNIRPKNSVTEGDVFRLLFEEGVDYRPSCSETHGTNFIDRNARLLYFTLKGSDKIVLKKANVVIVSFSMPAMTADEFFGSNIIENLAAMLNVPLNKVRVVNIVAAQGSRRRRNTDETTVIIEIGDEPTQTADESTGDVTDYASALMDSCQEGTINDDLGTTGTACDEIVIGDNTYQPVQPDGLLFSAELEPQHEGVPFSVQPKIRAYDTNGHVIPHLGIEESPWEITATLRSCTPSCGHADAELSGTKTIVSSNGWFNFTDLQISHKGEGYIIDFKITGPESAKALNLTLESAAFSVDAVPMTAGVYSMTSGDILQGDSFSLTLELRDSTTDEAIPDPAWRGHTAFDASCDLVVSSKTGNLAGTLQQTFDMTTGRVSFDDLSYTGYGLFYISCLIESTPEEFSFYSFHKVFVLGTHQTSIPSEASQNVKVRYNLDYDTTLPTEIAAAQLHQATLEHFISEYEHVIIRESTITRGSIVITFTLEGGSFNVTSAMKSICSEISDGLEVTVGNTTLKLDSYMTVDGTNYYATCGKSDDDDGGLHPAYIALIAILAVLLISIIFIVVYRLKIKPKSKTHGVRRFSVIEYPDNGRTVFLAGKHKNIQDIFYKQTVSSGIRPDSAAPITTLYDETPGYTHMRKSPLPSDQGDRSMTPTDK